MIGFVSVDDSPIGDSVMAPVSERNVYEGLVTLRILKGRSFRHSIMRVNIKVKQYLFQVIPAGVIYHPRSPKRRMGIRVNSEDDFNVMVLSVCEHFLKWIKVESNVAIYGREKDRIISCAD